MNFKQNLIFALILPLTFNLSYSETVMEEKRAEKLHPDLVEMMRVEPLDDTFFKDNLYIDLKGLDFPHDNYREIAEKVIRNQHQALLENAEDGYRTLETMGMRDADNTRHHLKEGESLLSFTFQGESINIPDYLPCAQYNRSACISETIEKRDLIQSLQKENAVLIKRYQSLLGKNRQFNTLFYGSYAEFDNFPLFRKLSAIQLAEAIVAFHDGDDERGFILLEAEREQLRPFFNPMSQSDIIYVMINSLKMQVFDQVLNGLFDGGYLDQWIGSSRLEALIAPYDRETTRMVIEGIQFELYNQLVNMGSVTLIEPLNLTEEEEFVSLGLMAEDFWLEEAENRKVFNELAIKYPELAREIEGWDRSEAALWESYHATFRTISDRVISENKIAKHLNDFMPIEKLNQEYGGVLRCLAILKEEHSYSDRQSAIANLPAHNMIDCNHYASYLYRVEENNNYHNLLFLKYRIERDKIANEDIPQFLESMGDLAKNRITKESFIWDAQKRTLSTPLQPEQKIRPTTVSTEETHWRVNL